MKVLSEKLDLSAGLILNINKPLGLTSFDVVRQIRQWTGCNKVGHAGTLDPLATGVLIVCTDSITKRISEFMEMEKEYEGIIELGKTTTTDDREGELLSQHLVPVLSREDIVSVLSQFKGEIKQVPPIYSALKINGQRLYRLARRGNTIQLKARSVHIYDIELFDWETPLLHIRVVCSKGTYIRALARDIGRCLGTGGYLKSLQRTRVGSFCIKDSYSLEEIKELFVDHASIQIH